MNTNTINGLMFILAGLTPPIVYLGLGPDGTGVLNMARTEQIFAYLFFSLPIAFMMTRRIQTNYFIDSGLIILVASMSMGMVADALGANISFTDMSDAVAVTAYSSIMLGTSICGIGILKTSIFPKWLSGLFTIIASISFILLATGEPSDMENNTFLIPVFLSVHLLMVVLGIFIFRRSE